MYLPSSVGDRESILCLYGTEAERLHAILQFVLSGTEQKERVVTVLDDQSSALAKSLLRHVDVSEKPDRYRGLPAEDFAGRAPLGAAGILSEVRRAVESWRGRPSTRPVRMVIDLRFIHEALDNSTEAVKFSHGISKLTSEMPVICLCLLRTDSVPTGDLQKFLAGFSQFVAAEPILSTDGRTRTGEPSKELDAALDRLLLSDETVMERTARGTARRFEYLSARAFLHVAGDHVMILDRNLGVEYMEAALSLRLRGTDDIPRGTSLATFCSQSVYSRLVSAFQHISSEVRFERDSGHGIVVLPVEGRFKDELVFEASVSAVSAYGRVFGFVCVLRDTGSRDEMGAGTTRAPAGVAERDGGSLLSQLPGKRPKDAPWKSLPRSLMDRQRVTAREFQILELILNGVRATDIGERLAIAPVTVKKHRANGYRKLGVRDRFDLFRLATTSG